MNQLGDEWIESDIHEPIGTLLNKLFLTIYFICTIIDSKYFELVRIFLI